MFKKKKGQKEVDFERLEFPRVSDAQLNLGGYPEDWFKETLEKARAEGITGRGRSKYEEKFNDMFYRDGHLELNKSLDDDYLNRGVRLFDAIASSFKPKHEHKAAVCAMILRSIEE